MMILLAILLAEAPPPPANPNTCATTGNTTICYNAQSSMTCTRVENVVKCEVIRK
jgi:hypothetical protein